MEQKSRQFKLVDGLLIVGLGLVAIGIGMNLKNNMSVASPKLEITKAVKITPTIVQMKIEMVFEMAGEVVKPGVYRLPKGSRVEDALIVSGGLAVNADRIWVEKNLNKAEPIGDGMKIYIPKINSNNQDTTSKQITNTNDQIIAKQNILGVQKSKIININTAGVEELDVLSGIGPAIAGRIIDYRVANGGFKDINELKLVSGIGEKMFEKIKDMVGI